MLQNLLQIGKRIFIVIVTVFATQFFVTQFIIANYDILPEKTQAQTQDEESIKCAKAKELYRKIEQEAYFIKQTGASKRYAENILVLYNKYEQTVRDTQLFCKT